MRDFIFRSLKAFLDDDKSFVCTAHIYITSRASIECSRVCVCVFAMWFGAPIESYTQIHHRQQTCWPLTHSNINSRNVHTRYTVAVDNQKNEKRKEKKLFNPHSFQRVADFFLLLLVRPSLVHCSLVKCFWCVHIFFVYNLCFLFHAPHPKKKTTTDFTTITRIVYTWFSSTKNVMSTARWFSFATTTYIICSLVAGVCVCRDLFVLLSFLLPLLLLLLLQHCVAHSASARWITCWMRYSTLDRA